MTNRLISRQETQALGQSEAFLALQERISRAARTDRSVIFIGERGTGKELAAARLHLLSQRWNEPYVTLNCAALAPSLIESELFGHEAGAFTGATRQRRGRFELSDGGSLFLDEVADIPMTAQEAILRVVEYGRFERLGGTETIQVDVRLITATNKDLKALAAAGEFREDLLDRLSFEVITLPPLRDRGEDVLVLAEYFARRMAVELGLEEAPEFSERARRALVDYPWPGNVRELKNVVERMVYRCAGEPGEPCAAIDEIIFDPFESSWRKAPNRRGRESADGDLRDSAHRPEHIESGANDQGELSKNDDAADLFELPLEEAVVELRVRRMRTALEAARFNQREAAERLGMTYHQFRGYYRKLADRLK